MQQQAASTESAELAKLSSAELAKLRKKRLGNLFDPRDRAQRAIDDKETPPGLDPLRQEQARQATAYVRGNAPSPFSHMSREELAAIAYDDTGAHTVNERLAAHKEVGWRTYQWQWQVVEAQAAERRRTGKTAQTDEVITRYYASLPLLDQVQYSAAYFHSGATAYAAMSGQLG